MSLVRSGLVPIPANLTLAPAGLTLILAILLAGAAIGSAGATEARWDAMEAPVVLGRDEASLDLFPAIGAELSRGFYGQTDPGIGGWWLHEFGAVTSYLGASENQEVRAGFAGGGERLAFGIQGSFQREQHADGFSDWYDDEIRAGRQEIESNRFQALASGAWKHDDALTLDLAVGLGYEDRRRDLFELDTRDPDTLLFEVTTEGVLVPAWSVGGRISTALQGGDLVGWFQWSELHAPEEIERRLPAVEEPAVEERFGLKNDRYESAIGWLGPVGEVDYLAIGIGGQYTESERWAAYISYPVYEEHRIDWSVYFFTGAEKRLKPWLTARGGFRQSYSSAREQRLMVDRGGGRSYDEERGDDFGSSPNLEVGIGLERGSFLADVTLYVSSLFDRPFKSVSVRYTF